MIFSKLHALHEARGSLRLAFHVLYGGDHSLGHLGLTGQQPAVDISGEIVSGDEEYRSARAIIQHLKESVKDLDADLSQSDRADLTAFRSLVQTVLEPATLCTMWLEVESYSTYTQVVPHSACSPCRFPVAKLSIDCLASALSVLAKPLQA